MSKPAAQADQDPIDPAVATSCFDFLLIELVPLAQRMAERAHVRELAVRETRKRNVLFDRPSANRSSITSVKSIGISVDDSSVKTATGGVSSVGASGAATNADTTTLAGIADDEVRDALFWKLDQMGYRVGQGLVERFSTNKARPQTPLDAIKFICKDLWILLFQKQIDNLKTNHRGVFVLTDNQFQPLGRMSVDRKRGPKAAEETLRRAQTFLFFPCGIIRGALAGFGIDVNVHADTTDLPVATFQIKTKTTS